METKINFSKLGTEIILTPETVAETAKLLRLAKNTALQPPSIHLSFSEPSTDQDEESVSCTIYMGKRNPKDQFNYITPRTK